MCVASAAALPCRALCSIRPLLEVGDVCGIRSFALPGKPGVARHSGNGLDTRLGRSGTVADVQILLASTRTQLAR